MSGEEGFEAVVFGECGGFKSEDGGGSGGVVPEFFRAFDAPADFFHEGFHQ